MIIVLPLVYRAHKQAIHAEARKFEEERKGKNDFP